MRNAKKCLSVIFSLLMIFSCFTLGTTSVSAETITENGVTYSYNVSTNTAVVTAYAEQSTADEVLIPETIQGCTVTKIAASAFMNKKIKSITLPGSVLYIDNFAFDGCVNLEEVITDAEFEKIGTAAFRRCGKLTSFNFGNSLKSIADVAFKESGLTSAEIPDTCETIGEVAFYGCAALESIKLPAKLQIINSGLLEGCTALEEIDIPAEVTAISSDAFRECDSLKSVRMGDKVESIGLRAFYLCKSLDDITLSESLKTISLSAFWDCSNLTSVDFPASLETLEDQSFRGCEKLEEVTLPYGLKKIGNHAFMYCIALKSIVIPETVEEISKSALSKVKDVVVFGAKDSAAETFAKNGGNNFIGYSIDDKGNATITAYNCPGVAEVVLPEEIAGAKVTAVGAEAFRGNTEIKSVKLSNDISYIGDMAFEGCANLENISFGVDGTYIGQYAFANCESIKTICLPMNIATIDECAFGYVSSGDEFVPDADFSIYSGINSAAQEYALANGVQFRFGLLKELSTGKIVFGVNYTEQSYKAGDEYRLVNVLGDVNGDEEVNVKDATLIQKFCASLAQIDEANIHLADTTIDGALNVRDATQIQKYAASIIDSFYN